MQRVDEATSSLGVIITTERTSGTRRKRPAAPLLEEQVFEKQVSDKPLLEAVTVTAETAPLAKAQRRSRKAVAPAVTEIASLLEVAPLETEVPSVKRTARGRKAAILDDLEPIKPAPVKRKPIKTAPPLEPVVKPRKPRAKKADLAPEPVSLEESDAVLIDAVLIDAVLIDTVQLDTVQLEVSEALVAPRTRRRNIIVTKPLETKPQPEAAALEIAALEPVAPELVITTSSEPTTLKPRARGRKATIAPEPALLEATQPDQLEPDQPEPNQSETDESQPVLTAEPQTPDQPVKRLVRSRKTARENVFESQAKLANPLEALLEHLRVNPGGRALRDLEKDVDDALLRRLGGRKGLEDALEELTKLGAVSQLKRHTYAASRDPNAVVGRLNVRPDGWGVLQPDTTGLREMLIPPGALLFAWHGDRVVGREVKKNGELYGAVIRVVERKRSVLVGMTEFIRGTLVLRPDDALLPVVPLLPRAGVLEGARVAAQLHYPESSGEDDVYGAIDSVLGISNSLEAERLAARIKFDLEPAFSADALKEAQKVAGVSLKDLQGRVDLRGKRVTAARIAADAPLEVGVQAEPLGNGNVLIGIHVADVAYFIEAGKALDAATSARGVSVDLSGERLPLLPAVLERAVEFKVGADRLAISVLVEATPDGNVVNYIVRQSVINAKTVLSDGLAVAERKLLERLTRGLREARGESSGVSVDDDGAMLGELLLLGNRLAATLMAGIEAPALYRRAPRLGADLEAALERSGGASAAMLQGLYEAHTKHGQLLMGVTLEPDLTLEITQASSRHADLVNQRVLSHCLTKLSARRRELLLHSLPVLAASLNSLEKNARLARDSVEQYQLSRQIAPLTPYRGIVTGIDPWGLNFALENGAQSRLALADMDDEYVFSDAPKMLKARSGRVFRIGSIARTTAKTTTTNVGTTPIQLSIAKANFKENLMSKQKRAIGAKNTTDTPRRQVVVLHAKPRGEYQRGVRVTARKLYFGEWSRAAFVASDEFGGEIALERPQSTGRPQGQSGRAQNQSARSDNRPNQPARTGQTAQPAQNQPRGPQQSGPADQGVTIRPTQTAAQREQAKASRIAELKRRSEQTLERNAARAVRGPMEGSSSSAPMQGSSSAPMQGLSDAAAVSPDANAPRAEGSPQRRRRRGGRGGNKTPAA